MMSSLSTSILPKGDAKYHMLRTHLDKLRIITPIDYKSLETIETMLNELLALRRRCDSAAAHQAQLEERIEAQAMTIGAYKHQNQELFKQTGELHKEIVALLEKGNRQGREMEVKRLNEDTTTLRYLINASKEKALLYLNELTLLKQRHMELIVSISEDKVNKEEVLKEIVGDEVNAQAQARYRLEGVESPHYQKNSGSNSCSPQVKYEVNSNSGMSQKMKATQQEMTGRIFKLEAELDDKNKEIALLRKSALEDNRIDSQVVIDYLKSQLKETKEKYESYLQFSINQQAHTNNSSSQGRHKSMKPVQREPKQLHRSISQTSIQQDKSFSLKVKLGKVEKENSLLKAEMEKLIDRFTQREKFIAAEIERNRQNEIELKEYKDTYHNPAVNTILNLNAKLKDSTSHLRSSKQHFKHQITEYDKKQSELQQQVNSLTQTIKVKDKECAQFRETINALNRKLYHITSNDHARSGV